MDLTNNSLPHDGIIKILDALPAVVYIVDTDTNEILIANKFTEKEFGNLDAKCYKAIYGFDKKCDFCPAGSSDEEALKNYFNAQEVENPKNNKWYKLHGNSVDWYKDRSVKIFIAFDITESKLRDSCEKNTHNLLRNIADNAPDMLWSKDIDGRYLFANKAICNNLLITNDTNEPIGKTDIFFAQRQINLHKNDKNWHTFDAMCKNSDIPVLEEQKAMKFDEYGEIGGEFIYLEVHKTPLYDVEGKLIGTVGTGRDVTRQKTLEKELRTLNDTLEKNVADKTSKIIEQERLLFQQARMSAMGEMIAAIAHQWRQPLNALGIMVQDVKFEHDQNGLSDEYMSAFKQRSMDQINFMSKTIDSFRDFFKINKEKVDFDVTEAILDVVRLLRPQFASSGIFIMVNAEKKQQVNGYPNEFMQVVLNILNNARDAIVDKKPQTPQIIIDVTKADNFCAISVADNGGGLDKTIIDKVFDPYFTTKGPDKGTGIGLYMSKTIIEVNMDGLLNARNKKDGCEFIIKIPFSSALMSDLR